jgi:hypothetical protein
MIGRQQMPTCPLCDVVYLNGWDAHLRTVVHREAEERERQARYQRQLAEIVSHPRYRRRSLRQEVLDTAHDLRDNKLSHTDVASWLLGLAERLEKK